MLQFGKRSIFPNCCYCSTVDDIEDDDLDDFLDDEENDDDEIEGVWIFLS